MEMNMKAIEKEHWTAKQALYRLQRKLETLPGWRDSLPWEAVERALDELNGGLFDAYYSTMPKNFVHWREKYSHDF
jgi:hypothetical protein